MRTFIAVPLLIAALAVSACGSVDTEPESDVANPNDIHQTYVASYTEGDTQVDFSAQFRFGGSTGTTLSLNSEKDITLDGHSMSFINGDKQVINLDGSYYDLKLPVDASHNNHLFIYRNADGRTFVNTVTIPDAVSIKGLQDGGTVSLAGGLQVCYTGSDLGKTEELDVVVQFDSTVSTESSSSSSSSGGFESLKAGQGHCVTFDASTFQGSPKSLTLYLMRQRSEKVQQGTTAGGILRAEYQTHSITVTVK